MVMALTPPRPELEEMLKGPFFHGSLQFWIKITDSMLHVAVDS